MRQGLRATRSMFSETLRDEGGEITPESLEEALLSADVGVDLAEALASELDQARRRGRLGPGGEMAWLRDRFRELLAPGPRLPRPQGARVTLVVGVNGTGKTTTAAKLAGIARGDGRRVMLVAADTFRAAAIEQLQQWGRLLDVPVVAQRPGADPAAVVFDALEAAKARDVEEVVIDTAGRLHTKHNLMAELDKVRRVCGRAVAGAPHEVVLVLDAGTGTNGVTQAREFLAHAGVTGVALTKLDGTAKGGVALAVVKELEVPVRWVGIGEGAGDLLPFDADAFTAALLEGLA